MTQSDGGLSRLETTLAIVDAILVVTFLIIVIMVQPFSSGAGSNTSGTDSAVEQTPDSTIPADPTDPAELSAFVLPSGNIWCAMTPTSATCTIANFTFTAPPAPADCAGTVGNTLEVVAGQEAQMVCVVGEPPAVPSGAPTLEYGEASTVGEMTCHSSTNGVTCRDNPTGNGFSLARAGYVFF